MSAADATGAARVRSGFHGQLTDLTVMLGELAGLAGRSMADATTALLEVAPIAAEQTIALGEQVRALRHGCEYRAQSMLALLAPAATDRRMLLSAIRISGDLAGMGGLAGQVADAGRRRFPDRVVPPETDGHFAEMGALSSDMADRVRHALTEPDLALLTRARGDNDRMDELHAQSTSAVTGESWHGGTGARDLAQLAGLYRRFAQHTVDVAERIVFLATDARPVTAD